MIQRSVRRALVCGLVLGAFGCDDVEMRGTVVSMNADGVVLRVTTEPGLWVYTPGATAAEVPASGSVDLRVPLAEVHTFGPGPGSLNVSVERRRDMDREEVGSIDIPLPMTVAAAAAQGAQVTWSLGQGPGTVPITGGLGDGHGRFADGVLELPFRGAPGTTLTVEESRETATAADGEGVLRLWLPPRMAAIGPGLHADHAPVSLSIAVTAPGSESRRVSVAVGAPAGRLLRESAPFATSARPLFPGPAQPDDGIRTALVADHDDTVRILPVLASPPPFGGCDVLVVMSLVNATGGSCLYEIHGQQQPLQLSSADVLAIAYDARTGAELGRQTVAATRNGCPAEVALRPGEQLTERPARHEIDDAAATLAGIPGS